MASHLADLDAMIAQLKADFNTKLAELEALRPQLIAEAIEEADAKAAAAIAEAAALRASLAPRPLANKNTNPNGPSEYNTFITAVWHEMAAAKGLVSATHDAAFKAAANTMGVTFAQARAEVIRLKHAGIHSYKDYKA